LSMTNFGRVFTSMLRHRATVHASNQPRRREKRFLHFHEISLLLL